MKKGVFIGVGSLMGVILLVIVFAGQGDVEPNKNKKNNQTPQEVLMREEMTYADIKKKYLVKNSLEESLSDDLHTVFLEMTYNKERKAILLVGDTVVSLLRTFDTSIHNVAYEGPVNAESKKLFRLVDEKFADWPFSPVRVVSDFKRKNEFNIFIRTCDDQLLKYTIPMAEFTKDDHKEFVKQFLLLLSIVDESPFSASDIFSV